MEVIPIGPFMVKWQLLSIIITVLIGYVVTNISLKRSATVYRKLLLDDLATTLLCSILIWKCSAILFEFSSIIHEPKLVLFYTGGTNGWVLAGVYAFVMLTMKTRKLGQDWLFYVSPAITWFIASNGTYHLLKLLFQNGGVYAVGNFILAAVMIFVQYRNSKEQREAQSVYQVHNENCLITILGYCLGLFVLSLLKHEPDSLWIGLTLRQLLLMLVICLTLTAKIIGENKGHIH
ncbi:hypothetical protein [Paenibacillus pini]|uniref:Uncharacterized protein n=1 Tax=Paenibacillus pini JCM 16418 TaxID=1236976 RepID=W7YJA8_9BACL|nr:hypothetical protein [Paenibacillus pini]GAF07698.1 hypothetical protein JCM16418_1726 [Paenibacillus pini JCM 16418]